MDAAPENIELCRELIGLGNFALVGLHPPTEFEADSFDLIYSSHVFCHFAEEFTGNGSRSWSAS